LDRFELEFFAVFSLAGRSEAMKASNIPGLSEPTLAAGETWKDLEKDSFDADDAGKRGYGYEILDQLAMEHLMGVKA
jgi:xylose isomerase